MFQYWGYLVLALFFMIIQSLFSTVSLAFIKPILDFVFIPKQKIEISTFSNFWELIESLFSSFFLALQKTSFIDFFSNYKSLFGSLTKELGRILELTDPYLLLYVISTMAILIIFAKNISFYGNRIFLEKLKNYTIRDIRNIIFDKYMKQSLSFFQKNKIGDSMVRMVDDVNQVSNLYITSIFTIVQNIIYILTLTILAIIINAKLFFMSIIIVSIFPYFVGLVGKKIKKYAYKIQKQFSSLFTHVDEVLSSMIIVKSFSKEKYENERFKKINNTYLKYVIRSVLYSSINTPLAEISSIFMIVVILIIGGRFVLMDSSSFSFGDFIVFIGAIASMLQPIKIITKAYTDLKKAGVSLERISCLMDLKKEIQEIKNPVLIKEFKSLIKIKNIDFFYNSEIVLKNINLEIKRGEKVAIVGRSGSGKTTLVNLIQRMFDVKRGKILFDGIDIKELKISNLHSLFGCVSQDSILFSETVAFNIAYGAQKNPSFEDIKKAAKIANAEGFINKLPNKYNEFLHSKGANLSGGQKQRICISRAIVANPPILIFDEATSALDSVAERKVQKAIEKATEKRTVISIAHRLSTILSSDKIVVLSEGKIIDVGTNEELLKRCKVYQNLYNNQFNV